MDIEVKEKRVSPEEAKQSINAILEENKLLSMSTVNDSEPHINTAFFACQDFQIIVFTPPDTVHGQNLGENSRVAVDIHESHQEWAEDKKGLQVFGSAEIKNSQKALDTYKRRFPEMKDLAENKSELEVFDSEFYVITPERIKIFDEPRFGTENWITVNLDNC